MPGCQEAHRLLGSVLALGEEARLLRELLLRSFRSLRPPVLCLRKAVLQLPPPSGAEHSASVALQLATLVHQGPSALYADNVARPLMTMVLSCSLDQTRLDIAVCFFRAGR